MQRAAPITQPTPNALKGIGLMLLALAVFSCLDTTAKYMATVVKLPLPQVVWLRFVSQFMLIVLLMGIVSLPRLLITQRIWHQALRSMLMLGSTFFNFIALKTLRLDQTQTIAFLAPFVVALLAGPFLGEWIRWRRMIAILIGFSGIVVAVRPGYATLEPGMIFAIGSMLCYSVFMLLTRYLAAYDPPEVTLFYSLIAGTFVMAPFALAHWEWPQNATVWLLLISMGFWGGLGHFIFILAYRHAPASVLAPFIYLGLITHVTGGYLVFGQVPDAWTLAGAVIVIGSGIYMVHRERVVYRERQKAHAAETAARLAAEASAAAERSSGG